MEDAQFDLNIPKPTADQEHFNREFKLAPYAFRGTFGWPIPELLKEAAKHAQEAIEHLRSK